MPPAFELSIGGHRVRAELLVDAAPRIGRAFQECLPLTSFAVHAKFAGDELIVMLPFFADPENEVSSVVPGDIGYYPSRQTLCLFYGEIVPFASVSLFARVRPDDLPLARAAGRIVLEAGALPVYLTLCRTGALAPADSAAGRPASPAESIGIGGETLHGRLGREARAIWTSEPADVQRLRAVARPPMGNVPCVLYANFDLFWAGENLQVCRDLAREGRLPAEHVARVTAALLDRTRDRLSKWGFADTVALLAGLSAEIAAPSTGTAVESSLLLGRIEGALLYLDRLQSWIDALIPWAELDHSVRLKPQQEHT